MDLLGYAAFTGIERVAIIAGALIIGYWGYRLYARDKTPGLIFMGISCAVLIAALATGGSHIRSVGASYQLAGGAESSDGDGKPLKRDNSAGSEGIDPTRPSATSPFQEPQAAAASAPADQSAQQSVQQEAEPADGKTRTAAGEPPTGESTIASATTELAREDTPDMSTDPASAQESASELALSSSRELGGRIVSIKSENLTLEWSQENAETAP